MRRGWTIRDSLELYNVAQLGRGLLRHQRAGPRRGAPRGPEGAGIDLLELVQDLERRGLRAPLLIRFSDILASRVRGHLARLRHARSPSTRYQGRYRGVYPIKVNQQRHVVEEIVQLRRRARRRPRGRQQARAAGRAGAARHARRADRLQRLQGPRLHRDGAAGAAARPHADHRDRPLPRDRPGDQDRRASSASARTSACARGSPPRAPASGSSRPATARSSASRRVEIVEAVERLRAEDMLDCLELLHFHIGSQITAIRAHKDALREASRIFVGPARARRAADAARRRRRPRRRLRRLADELPLVDELLDAGVRQRRGGARSRRPATRPACRTRTSSPRPGARWWRTTRCWSSTCSA